MKKNHYKKCATKNCMPEICGRKNAQTKFAGRKSVQTRVTFANFGTLLRIFSVVLVDFVILFSFNSLIIAKMSSAESTGDESLYPIAVLIDELRNEDVQVGRRVRTDFRPL